MLPVPVSCPKLNSLKSSLAQTLKEPIEVEPSNEGKCGSGEFEVVGL